MSLRSIIEDIANSPRQPRPSAAVLEIPTAMFHRLPEELRAFLTERKLRHQPTWQTQDLCSL